MITNNLGLIKENVIVDNIFSKKDLNLLYQDIDIELQNNPIIQNMGRVYVPLYFKKNTDINNEPCPLKITQELVDIVIKKANKYSNFNLELESISYAKYSLDYGIPELKPHTDSNFKKERLTFDIQLNSNIDWPIVIENNQYILKNNQALVFSGTNQIHWRTKKIFKNLDYVDMIFFQFSDKTNTLKDLDSKIILKRNILQKSLSIKYEKGLI